MSFTLPNLPWAHSALAERGMSQETLELHHDKHHQAYVTALNGFVEKNDDLKGKSLEEIIAFLSGDTNEVLRRLTVQMNEAAEALEFLASVEK